MLRPPSYFKPTTSQADNRPQSSPLPTENKVPDPLNTTRLQDQLITLTTEHTLEIKELNQQITQYLTDIQNLKTSLSDREIAFSREKNDLEREYKNTINTTQEENDTFLGKIHELESILTQQQYDRQEREQQIQSEKEENIRLKQSINSIVTYPEREQEYKSTITELNTQVEHSLKQIQFLNLRLDALQDILELQERNLTQNSNESIENLLAMWRGKVFELLIRKKCIQIDTDTNTERLEFQFRSYQDKICKLENESELQKLCINERSVQIESLYEDLTAVSTKNRQLVASISSYQNLEKEFKQTTQNNLTKLSKLSRLVNNLYEENASKITLLLHRISFLKDRVGFLVDCLIHNRTRLKPSHEQAVQTCFPDSCLHHVELCGEDILSLPHGTLVNEIQLLVRERGILRKKLRENSDSSKQELQQFKQDSTLEIEGLRNELRVIQQGNFNVTQENQFFQSEIEKLEKNNQENEMKIQNLHSKLLENNSHHEQERSFLRQDLQQKHSESLNELENRLHEVNQNYCQVQGQLSEAYRTADEKKELAIGNLKIENQDLRRKLEETRVHLQAMEAEKSILSSSLRTIKSSQNSKQPLIQSANLIQELSIESPLQTLLTELPHDDDTPPDANGNPIQVPSTPNHIVPARELVSMVQELTQLSSQIFSL